MAARHSLFLLSELQTDAFPQEGMSAMRVQFRERAPGGMLFVLFEDRKFFHGALFLEFQWRVEEDHLHLYAYQRDQKLCYQ